MSRSRAAHPRLILLVVLSLLAACSGPADRRVLPTADPSSSPTPSGSKGDPQSKASPSASPGATSGARQNPEGTRPVSYNDHGGVGAMAKAYLRRSPARALRVEIDFAEGRRPTQQALDHIRKVLQREASKPSGIDVKVDDQIPASRDEYTFEQIEALEKRYRDDYSAGRRAVLYVLYLNGDLADEDGTLGVAYRGSGIVLFHDRIKGAATSLVRPGAIERAVLTHEVGHLFGLINIGYTSKHDHEDPDHPKHSRFSDSVMYWAIEDVSVASLLGSGPPSDFDRFDRDDLALLRG